MGEDMADERTMSKRTRPGGSSNKSAAKKRNGRRAEDIRSSLLNVREEQATLYDPKERGFRCCRGFKSNGCQQAVFDHEEESTARVAQPLDTIPESELNFPSVALNVLYVKVSESDVGFPISLYGTILMRDDLDFKCIHLFKRDRDNCQVINSPGEMLMLTGPDRGPFDADDFYFEFNLKIKGDEESMDRIFSRTLVGEEYPLGPFSKKQPVLSWLSELELAYRSVHYAVEATVGIKILRGPREVYGRLTASSTEESTEMVLYDSESWGARAADEDGTVALPRSLVVLREDEDLILKFCVFGRGHRSKPKTVVCTLEHSDKSFNIKRRRYELLVTVSWSRILTRV